jgi:hypothetical protein
VSRSLAPTSLPKDWILWGHLALLGPDPSWGPSSISHLLPRLEGGTGHREFNLHNLERREEGSRQREGVSSTTSASSQNNPLSLLCCDRENILPCLSGCRQDASLHQAGPVCSPQWYPVEVPLTAFEPYSFCISLSEEQGSLLERVNLTLGLYFPAGPGDRTELLSHLAGNSVPHVLT